MASYVTQLYQALQTRPRPEDVAELIVEALGDTLSTAERACLDGATRHSARALGWQYSSMAADFLRPHTGVQRQVETATALWAVPPPVGSTPSEILTFVRALAPSIGKIVGANDFRQDRQLATKHARRAAGIYKNARWVNKRWRLLQRIETKLERLAWNEQRYQATRLGKSGLASLLSEAEVASDLNTSCFLAYLAARMSRRSTFTNTAQERAFDTIAAMLLHRCEASATTNWDLIAHVWPDQRILHRLSENEKGALLARWWETLRHLAGMLRRAWESVPGIERTTMVVQRGQDSTTWNQIALAWNTTRQAWLETLIALRCEDFLMVACPGKVMRVMAADVAAWHRLSGGDVHPDTRVWAALPFPWDVLEGQAACTSLQVQAACHRAGVKSGSWLGARTRPPVPFTPTPELVHGVAVSSPSLALLLRKAGVFSGQRLRGGTPPITVHRDAHGYAILATPAVAADEKQEEARQ